MFHTMREIDARLATDIAVMAIKVGKWRCFWLVHQRGHGFGHCDHWRCESTAPAASDAYLQACAAVHVGWFLCPPAAAAAAIGRALKRWGRPRQPYHASRFSWGSGHILTAEDRHHAGPLDN